MAINGIIFDLDGTLIDTFDTQLKSWREAFEKVGSRLDTDKFANNFGKSYKDFTFSIDPSLTNLDIDQVIQTNKNLMEKRSNEYSLFPESRKILETLNEKQITCMVASSNPRRVSESLLKQFQIDHLFGKVVGPDDVKNGKPAPDMLNLALNHHKIHPSKSIMVGDTAHDILAGKSASTKTALILRREEQHNSLSSNPDYIINNLEELIKHLD